MFLKANSVMSENAADAVLSKATKVEKASDLLSFLQTRDTDAYDIFVEGLRECEVAAEIVELLSLLDGERTQLLMNAQAALMTMTKSDEVASNMKVICFFYSV